MFWRKFIFTLYDLSGICINFNWTPLTFESWLCQFQLKEPTSLLYGIQGYGDTRVLGRREEEIALCSARAGRVATTRSPRIPSMFFSSLRHCFTSPLLTLLCSSSLAQFSTSKKSFKKWRDNVYEKYELSSVKWTNKKYLWLPHFSYSIFS